MLTIEVHALIHIENHRVLLVYKQSSSIWILPGGKPHEGEAGTACLRREVQEELGCDCILKEGFLKYQEITPQLYELIVQTYRGTVEGRWIPNKEITEAGLFTLEEAQNLPMSSIGRKILKDLEERHLLK